MKRRAPERDDRLGKPADDPPEATAAEATAAPAREEHPGPMRVAGFVEGSGVRDLARVAGVIEVAAWTRGLLRRARNERR